MKKVVYIFFVTKTIHTNKDNCDRKSAEKNVEVESPICRARSQICTQYMLGVIYVLACHLALMCQWMCDDGCKSFLQ